MSKALNVSPKTIVIDLVITGAVWLFFSWWFTGHVPSESESAISLVAAFSALPAAGTFWFCLQMFKVTLAHQRKLKKESAQTKA